MTAANNDELASSISGFPPQASHLLGHATTRPIFTSIIVILKVYPVLMLLFGSVGNFLSFCVLLRANMRRYSTFCYLAALALVDLAVIITFCTNFILLYHFNNDIQSDPFACKLYAFSVYFLPQYSSWLLVAVSIDRVISAKYLRLAKTWSKPRHSVLVTLLLGLFLGILNSHFFIYENNSLKSRDSSARPVPPNRTALDRYLFPENFLSQHPEEFPLLHTFANTGPMLSSSASYESYTPPSVQRETTIQQQFESFIATQNEVPPPLDVNPIYCSLEKSPKHAFLHFYWTWFDLLMNVFVPFTAMIACTVIIILTLVRSSSRAGSTSARRSRHRRNISVMLITVNLVFISLTAPIVIFLSVYDYVRDYTDYTRQTVLVLIKVFCIILMNLNHSVNIIIYSITAKEFRTEMTNFLHAVLYVIIGRPVNPNDFAYIHDDGTIASRLRRLRQHLFNCCRKKLRSNSTNTTDSSGLQHTTAPGRNKRSSSKFENTFGKTFNKGLQADHRNGRRKSSGFRYSETSTTQRLSHRLTVQYQPDGPSTVIEREDLSLHGLSNSTED